MFLQLAVSLAGQIRQHMHEIGLEIQQVFQRFLAVFAVADVIARIGQQTDAQRLLVSVYRDRDRDSIV